MTTYKDQIYHIWEQYRREVSTDPVDLKEVAAWAIKKGLWKPRPVELTARLAQDLADSLRERTRTDGKNRRYRSIIPVRKRGPNGAPLFEWGDIDDAPHAHVEKSVQQERRSIVSDCYALAMKVEHYNDTRSSQEQLKIVLNFEDDVAEMKIANGVEDDDAA